MKNLFPRRAVVHRRKPASIPSGSAAARRHGPRRARARSCAARLHTMVLARRHPRGSAPRQQPLYNYARRVLYYTACRRGRNKLWTKDFTIITLGTASSTCLAAVAGFGSVCLPRLYRLGAAYAISVCYSLPRVVLPLFAGPYLDRFSRKRMLYMLDFLSAGLYLIMYVLIQNSFFNYASFLILAMLVGSVDSVYVVTYESFYPQLIREGNYTRAYSISSLIYPLTSAIMVPIAGFCYKSIGLAPLFLFNAVTFLAAAIAETQIGASESHLAQRANEKFGGARFFYDLKEGISYLRRERGLLTIAAYFFVLMLTYGVSGTLVLPYFKALSGNGVAVYVRLGASTIGRLAGRRQADRHRYPTSKKYAIALVVAVALSFLEGRTSTSCSDDARLDAVSGMLSHEPQTSASAARGPTRSTMRARFNGLFQMLNMLGTILGQLIAGAVGDALPIRAVIAAAMAVNLLAVFAVVVPNGAHVKKIYNVNV